MYRCVDCGAIFEEPKVVSEYRGECFGFPAYEDMIYCPFCNGDVEDYEEPTGYWVSAYTETGTQFGDTIQADNADEMFDLFYEKHPNCEIADYGRYDEM